MWTGIHGHLHMDMEPRHPSHGQIQGNPNMCVSLYSLPVDLRCPEQQSHRFLHAANQASAPAMASLATIGLHTAVILCVFVASCRGLCSIQALPSSRSLPVANI